MKNRLKSFTLLIVSGLTLAVLAGCEFSVGTVEPGIGEIVTCVELDDNMTCVDETTIFDGRTRMNASARATVSTGDVIEIRWWTEGKSSELNSVQLKIDADDTYPVGSWLTPDPVLPNGIYTVTYFLNGEAVREAAVEVAGVTPEVVGVIACESAPKDGVCTPRTDPFDGTQTLHFLIEMIETGASDVLTAQVTQDDAVIVAVDMPLRKDSTLAVPFELRPKPVLLTGDYLLELTLNETPAMTTTVAIEGPEPQIIDAITCSEIDEYQACVQAQEIFDGASPIFASAEFIGMTTDDTVSVRWLLGDRELASFSYQVDQPGNGSVSFNIEPRTPLPVGDYLAEIIYEDEVVATAPFFVSRITGQKLTPVRAATTCREISQDYDCIEPTTTYAPSDTFFLWLEVVNIKAEETLTARWLENAGSPIKETPFTFETEYTGKIYFDLTPDTSFPPDEYAVEIYYGDLLVDRMNFTIAAE